MIENTFVVSLEKNPRIAIKVIPGHFTTSNTHFSHYLDVNELKFNASVAKDTARELAIPYVASTLVDTIVCMERTEAIGAYLAEELVSGGISVMNSERAVYVVSPYGKDGKLIFVDSMEQHIRDKSIILLIASVSSGTTLNSILESISYYGGRVVGVSALYVSAANNHEQNINGLFTSDDIPDFKAYRSGECEMCRNGHKLDAMVSSIGYTKI